MFKKINSFGVSFAIGFGLLAYSFLGNKFLPRLMNNHLVLYIIGYIFSLGFASFLFLNLYRWLIVFTWKNFKLNYEYFGLKVCVLLVYLLLGKEENLPEKFNATIKPKFVSKLEQEDFDKDCKLSDASLFNKYLIPVIFAVALVCATLVSPNSKSLIAIALIFIANGISKLNIFEFKEVVSKENS